MSSENSNPPSMVKQEEPCQPQPTPKSANSAFYYFYKTQLKVLRQGNKNISQLDAAFVLSEKFRNLSPKDKSVYEKQAKLDEKRFLKEIEKLQENDIKVRKRD